MIWILLYIIIGIGAAIAERIYGGVDRHGKPDFISYLILILIWPLVVMLFIFIVVINIWIWLEKYYAEDE